MDYETSKYYPTRADAERLSEIGMFVSGYLERPQRNPYMAKEHKDALSKIFKFIFMFVEEREQTEV